MINDNCAFLQEVETVDIDGKVFVRHLSNDNKLSTILE